MLVVTIYLPELSGLAPAAPSGGPPLPGKGPPLVDMQNIEGYLPTGGPSLTPLIPLSTGDDSTAPTPTAAAPAARFVLEVMSGARGGGAALKSTGAAGGSLPGSSSDG